MAERGPGPAQITGLILAGGEGRRMGGQDKGLLLLHGRPLAAHALERLAPQVGQVLMSANRHAGAYAALGVPVLEDCLPGFLGPLAGLLTGLQACGTDWLLSVPCDSPALVPDLAARLATALGQAPEARVALVEGPDEERGGWRLHPALALMHRSLAAPLAQALAAGERRLGQWLGSQPHVRVRFDRAEDALMLANANTPEALAALADRWNARVAPP
ncbi:molybdenum cofactor guanylyltransferase MobA [Mitsuaria sp. WAJ17]|uniref:molybdenum cofactor guanylyltransferase MobA n=1 Tax=Mitsuaria sp. WAJ17 TaxID=2761452 RepID=UPI002873A97C|nr:molybdenum cofactor guanylyltransferase MobA [Mitsuaria sp. WAJ17]